MKLKQHGIKNCSILCITYCLMRLTKQFATFENICQISAESKNIRGALRVLLYTPPLFHPELSLNSTLFLTIVL